MDRKNVYMVQANYLYGKEAYLPYAAGALAACAWADKEVNDNYVLKRFVFVREDVEEAVDSFERPYLVTFSNYIWNFEYNKAFAKKLKEKYPECIVVFGGHNIREDSPEALEEYDFIDILIHGEGEEPFRELLKALNKKGKLSELSNISFRNDEGNIVKTENKFFDSVDYPSPYLEGIFDEIMKNERYSFTATLETNRGCPFRCAYCDWGSCGQKLRKFPMERIKGDIEWIAKHNVDLCFCADANFGILERDNEITDYLIDVKKKYGYPNKFRVCYTKNSNMAVFNINKKLDEYSMSKGATLSFQSLSPVVLKNIGRENLTLDRFKELMAMYNASGIPTHSEIILGLPGETYDSFCDGISKLLENGQHTSINIFNCEILMNSEMGKKEFIEKHGIKSIVTAHRQDHSEYGASDGIGEKTTVVCATDTMDTDMWVKANMFSFVVQGFHCLGLLQCVAIYLYYEKNIEYGEFYKKLIEWIISNPETVSGKYFLYINDKYKKLLSGEGSWLYYDEKFGNVQWTVEEGVFLEAVYDADKFYREIEDFLKDFPIEKEIYGELMKYQKNIIKYPGRNVFEIPLEYDFYNYFRNVYINDYKPLRKIKNTLRINDENLPDNWEDYARKIVWYGRKGGKNIHTQLDIEYR